MVPVSGSTVLLDLSTVNRGRARSSRCCRPGHDRRHGEVTVIGGTLGSLQSAMTGKGVKS